MSEAQCILLRDAEASLIQRVQELAGDQSLREAFAAWVTGDAGEFGLSVDTAVEKAMVKRGAARTYEDVATLGYGAALNAAANDSADGLRSGLDWLVGRRPFSSEMPPTFEKDGIALLGVALGARKCGSELEADAASWLAGFLPKSCTLPGLKDWQKYLMAAAAKVINGDEIAQMPADRGTADVRVALQSKGFDFSAAEGTDEAQLLDIVLSSDASETSPARCAVRLAALRWVRRSVPRVSLNRPTDEDVVRLLEGLARSLRRWCWEERSRAGGQGAEPVRWSIQNEFHVQDLLWVLLAPVFSDLEDEENLPSLGPKHPRYDLGIPSLRMIVEAKFMRRGTQREASDLIGEISEDAGIYLREASGYDKLIAFIWDDSRSTEQHAELKQGLLKIDGVVGAVIVARPAKMGNGE